ncbi:MAG: acetyl-CoA carboxylase biotin carboxyl carrier protein [Deferribacteres bacterium]|nr:acetyl-CoA carboxylase biotin carboxyl carrier protein [candidate division KSB1 bacterium]MCB9501540.1 acetyl-CoA carboxylase biotin carboxyl carrier protein [Deferribacteres bacterium]
MTEDQIQRLIKMVENADIAELEVSKWGRKVRISKFTNNLNYNMHVPQQVHVPVHAPAPAPVAVPASEPKAAPVVVETPAVKVAAAPEQPAGEEIRSPMVGTFYRAPAPEADPYVNVGDTVKQGQVLCIIEAMKLMNEVEAEFPCRIIKISNDDGQPVEYNQPLFVVERI